MTDEQWGFHPDFPYHEISTHGRVRKSVCDKSRWALGTILRGNECRKGYLWVRITNAEGKYKLRAVHRLVLETFVGPAPADKYESGHRDGSKDNNRLENLRWVSPKENQADRNVHGTSNRGERNPMYIHGGYVGSKGYK